MRSLKLFFLFTGLISVLYTFGQTANITEGCFPLTINFTAPGSSSTFFWDFKDGATSALQNPSNTFLNAGTYVVEFRETTTGPIVGTVTINVYAKPVPEFLTDVTKGCAPLTVNFTNNTTLNPGIVITGYSWVFGDGGTASGANPSHTFTLEGNYFVSLELITNLATCNVTKAYNDLISLTNPPNTAFTTSPNDATSCTAPLDVSFTNTTSGSGAPLTYNWDLGNGNTSTATSPPTQTYTTLGSFPVTLTATDTNGCQKTIQKNVSIGSPIADLLFKDTVCVNVYDTIFNQSTAGVYTWNYGANYQLNPAINTGLSTQGYFQGKHPVIRFTTPGMHSVTLTVNAGGCMDDTTITFFVEEIIADFVSNPTYSCEDPMLINFTNLTTNAVSYYWNFDNGDTSIVENPNTTYMVEDTTIYSINGPNTLNNYFVTTLTVTSAAGCKSTISHTDTIHEPNALLMPDVVDGCLPLTVVFSDSSSSNEPIVNWEWFFGDGTSISSANDSPQSHTYITMGEYDAYLVITNSAGCTDTSYLMPIKVGDVIVPDFTVDVTDVCPGDSVQFTDLTPAPLVDSVDAWHYYTEGSLMFHCFQDPDPIWVFNNETGPQDVTLVVGFNGCYSSITKSGFINVKGPIAKFNYFSTCENPYTIDFADSSRSATSIIWNFGDGDTSSIATPTHTYAATGDYTVVLHAINSGSGCADSYDTATVHIRDIQANFISDSLLCQNVPSSFNAGLSQDVYSYCNSGYTWYFSDSGVRPITTGNASEPLPFPTTGLNEVTLVVTDINGCKDTASAFVNVFSIDANYTIDDTIICLPTLVTFNNTSTSDTSIVNWQWNFGDGQSYNGQDTSHTYTSSGTSFPVRLIVTNAVGCVDTLIKPILVYKPTSVVGVSDNTVCAGTTVNFTATDYTLQGSNLTFNWNFTDGNTSILQNPNNAFATGGTYFVNMVYEEISSGCKDSVIQTIFVQEYPTAAFTSSADAFSVICPNDNVLFTNTSISSSPIISYQWDFGNGSTSTFANPGTPYGNNGTYTVQLTVTTSFTCPNTTTHTYTVRGPSGNFFTDLNGDTICRLEEVLFTTYNFIDVDFYTWDFGDGTTASNVSPISHPYTFVPPGGQTIAKLIMSNLDGSCPVTDTATINIYEVIADFDRNFNDIDTAICFAPYPFTNTSTNANVWFWDFGDSQTSTAQNPSNHNYALPGIYQVTLGVHSTSLTCTDSITKEIILHPIPEVTAIGDTICEGEIGIVYVENPSPNSNYFWTSNPFVTITNDTLPVATSQPLTTTNYSVTVTDSNNCVNADNTTLYVINELLINNFDTIVAMGDDVILPIYLDAGLYTFTWTPETGLSCLDCAPPTVINPLVDVLYTLTYSDIPKGCFPDKIAYFDIKVHPETFIKVPTTFTPNGDGVNDIIYAKGWGVKELIEFKIFNRWGELIFISTDLEIGWDGYYKGVLQNNDIYVYKIQALTWRDEVQALEGHINLMR
ncbi:MAG: PKD domain-containing protein [Bacteroidetes bacterium]|nr:PKD domain-containing protein [Bacteroidota bacterium]